MHHSEVMSNLAYLTDMIGPRLTGSAAVRQANEWTLARFRDYGLAAHLEPWTFGGTWTRGPIAVRLVAPWAHDVIAASWAWAPGTGGATRTGPVVRIDGTVPDSLARQRGRLKGAWVMLREPSFVWNSDGPAMGAADSARRDQFLRGYYAPFQGADSATRAQLQQFANDLPYLLRRAGALGMVVDAGKEQGLLNMSGSPNRILPLPQIVVAHEDYALFDRLLTAGAIPRLAVSIVNRMSQDSIPQWNTIAELRGTERPSECKPVAACGRWRSSGPTAWGTCPTTIGVARPTRPRTDPNAARSTPTAC
jgi:hypothetical protein